MRVLSILTTAFAACTTVSAFAIEARDAATVVGDIRTLTTQLNTLQNQLKAFQGGAAGTGAALQIQGTEQTIENTLKKAAQDASNSPNFGNSGSADVANAIVGVERNIYSVLDLLIQKKSAFATAALGFSATGLVLQDLKNLKSQTDAFGANASAKLVPELAKLAPLLLSNIDYHYSVAIDAYSS
ncbi:hypothetical protein FH972_022142 [Carpinus fangiana]|uniref:Pectinesterase inhibitor domain-containing protein n=1 Tax=Carpinus fangiana TaxID=176857 RepID=A0A5N6KRQ9_9ROSI|nr:hypothetical protein FH972_022142 [Carpinus fangiana]